MADVAVVIGHHPGAPGATLDLCGHTVSEYDLWEPFGRELAVSLHADQIAAEVVHRPSPSPGQDLADRVNATGATCAIELHFNAAEDVSAQGTEMIHWPGSKGRLLARRLKKKTIGALATRDRGVQARGDLAFLRLTEMPAVICEPAFGTNEDDAWKLLTRQAALMRAYREALRGWLQG